MEFKFLLDDEVRTVTVERKDGGLVFREGEGSLAAEVRSVSENELLFVSGGRSRRVFVARDGKRKIVLAGGREFVFTEPDRSAGRRERRGGKAREGVWPVKAPMPGKVIKLCVAEGEAVRENQALAIVEAMKMENVILSEVEGVVKKILVTVGELVDAERPLIEVEAKA